MQYPCLCTVFYLLTVGFLVSQSVFFLFFPPRNVRLWPSSKDFQSEWLHSTGRMWLGVWTSTFTTARRAYIISIQQIWNESGPLEFWISWTPLQIRGLQLSPAAQQVLSQLTEELFILRTERRKRDLAGVYQADKPEGRNQLPLSALLSKDSMKFSQCWPLGMASPLCW